MKGADDRDFLLFRAPGSSITSTQPSRELHGLRFTLWRPSPLNPIPPGQRIHYAAWWGLHEARVFRSRRYAVLLVRDGERVVHRSCIMPAWFRWPFMDAEDIHISDTWTDPDYRGRGIAAFAARLIVAHAEPTQTVWYATQEWNEPSLAVCRSLGDGTRWDGHSDAAARYPAIWITGDQ